MAHERLSNRIENVREKVSELEERLEALELLHVEKEGE